MSAVPVQPPVSLLAPLASSPEAKNFGLSEEAFDDLRTALREGDERLYERIFLEHFNDCMAYLKAKDGAEHNEAYDATMETMLTFRDLLVAGKIGYGNLRYLFTRMARQHLRRTQRRQGTFTSLPASASELPEEEAIFSTEEYDLLARAFRSMAVECRELLWAFYFQRRTLKELAGEENLPAPTLRKRKSRCVAALRQYFYHIS